jgi:hypothetical protein
MGKEKRTEIKRGKGLVKCNERVSKERGMDQ